MKTKIFVTGGAGYIGSHVCKALSEAGFQPIAYDNLSNGYSWAVQWGPFIEGDITDFHGLKSAFDHYRPRGVIHMAASINVRESIENPELYYRNNIFGSLTLLNAMTSSNIRHLVFSSTAAVYGTPQFLPMSEEHPKHPLNAYGKTKLAVEEMLKDFAYAHNLRFAALRYFNACGADPGGCLGEAHEPETHLIPLAIKTAMGIRKKLTIYGNDYPTEDGTAVRDYVHVCDLADAHVKALRLLLSNPPNHFQLNLGTGTGYSVRQIIKAIEEYSHRKVPTSIKQRLQYDSPALVADPKRAKELLNWEPQYSSLETIISTAWNWHVSHQATD